MAQGKLCGYCGHQKRRHPNSGYLTISYEPHKWVAEDDKEGIKKLKEELKKKVQK